MPSKQMKRLGSYPLSFYDLAEYLRDKLTAHYNGAELPRPFVMFEPFMVGNSEPNGAGRYVTDLNDSKNRAMLFRFKFYNFRNALRAANDTLGDPKLTPLNTTRADLLPALDRLKISLVEGPVGYSLVFSFVDIEADCQWLASKVKELKAEDTAYRGEPPSAVQQSQFAQELATKDYTPAGYKVPTPAQASPPVSFEVRNDDREKPPEEVVDEAMKKLGYY